MEVFFFQPEEYKLLYNCSAYNVDDIPLSLRQHKVVGALLIFVFFIYEVN